jgi:hypothetical protein
VISLQAVQTWVSSRDMALGVARIPWVSEGAFSAAGTMVAGTVSSRDTASLEARFLAVAEQRSEQNFFARQGVKRFPHVGQVDLTVAFIREVP